MQRVKSEANWINMGPLTIPEMNSQPPGMRRINAIAFHPTNPNVILAVAGSGIYKSTDLGENWTVKSTTLNIFDY